MKDLRQALLGILAALISGAIILGSIVLALTESGQRVAQVPASATETSSPMPPIDTPKPGEPTFTPSPTPQPTRIVSTPTIEPTYSCVLPPGWSPVDVFAGDTLESLARDYSTTKDILLQGNCIDPEELKNNDIMIGMVIYVPLLPTTARVTPTATTTSTKQPAPTNQKSAQNKPKTPQCSGPPASWVAYYVRSGDNLSRIALATGTTVSRLRAANCLTSTIIHPGDRLWVPRLPPIPTLRRSATPRPTRTPTLTRTTLPTAVPSDTPLATNTPLPTDPPAPTDPPPPTVEPSPPPYP